MTRPRTVILAAAAAAVIVALVLTRYLASSDQIDPADAFFQSQATSTDRDPAPTPVAPAPTTTRADASMASGPADARPIAAARSAVEPSKAPAIRVAKHVVSAAPDPIAVAKSASETRDSDEAVAERATDTAPADTAPTPAAAVTPVAVDDQVTITGCLEISTDDDRFRLADTEGAGAPKARSWRSGFLKKRAAPVDLVAPADALSQQQVGKRVAATGVLTNRELKVRSVRVVSASCN